ncbi:MAG: phosphate-starvation-inducible PsiE family protein [Methylococcales bacterium]
MKIGTDKIQTFGNKLVDVFHFLALFLIGATIVWTAAYEYIQMAKNGHASLKDILLLFIYLELGAMVGVYFKTKKLPVQFLIFVAITGLSRHLVVDVQGQEQYQLNLMLSISTSILLLSIALFVLAFTANKFGCPDETIQKTKVKRSD